MMTTVDILWVKRLVRMVQILIVSISWSHCRVTMMTIANILRLKRLVRMVINILLNNFPSPFQVRGWFMFYFFHTRINPGCVCVCRVLMCRV